MAALAFCLAVCSVLAYPKPAVVSLRWELEFEPGAVRLYVDQNQNRAYWYFTYKVTNRTGRDQVWAPRLVLFTDAGAILPGGRRVPSRVVDDLIGLLGNDLLETQNEIIGEIYQGRGNAREGLVVWPASNLQVNELSLFVGGISGETTSVENPVTGERVLLRKTLQRDYLIRGDAAARGSDPLELAGQRWVMR